MRKQQISISPKRQIFLGYFFAIGATAIWSGNFIIARGLSESIPPISLAFYRWVVAVIVFLPFALKLLIIERKIIKDNLLYLVITALLGVTFFNTLIYFAGHTTTAINLSLISVTFPVFIVILDRVFYGEKITLNKGVGVLLVAAGVITLITKGSALKLLDLSYAIGDIWMLIAAIIFAIYSIMLKKKPKELSIWAFQLSIFIIGLVFLTPFYIWEFTTHPPVIFDLKIISSILYIGVFASFAAFVLWSKAIMVIGPSKAGMIYYTLPLFSGVSAYFFLNESIGLLHLCSAAFIITGILTANFSSYTPINTLNCTSGSPTKTN